MAGLRRFRSVAVSKSWLMRGAYRAGTGAGGRKRDRDAPVVAACGFAATRFALSMDSR
jgi:hypothetical protein